MKESFLENIHHAAPDCPYLDGEMRNINYLSHFHKEIEIAVVLRGSVNILCNSVHFVAKEGDICLFLPGEIHSFSTTEYNHLYILKINAGNSVEHIDWSAYRLDSNLIPANTEWNRTLRTGIDHIVFEMYAKKEGYAYVANAAANQVIVEILRSGRVEKMDNYDHKWHQSAVLMLQKINEYVENHYDETISLMDVAAFCNFSKYYFAHLFRKITGTTFYEYLTSFRLKKTLTLLVDTEDKIADIAQSCGFFSSRSYYRSFLKEYGMSPGKYRLLHKR